MRVSLLEFSSADQPLLQSWVSEGGIPRYMSRYAPRSYKDGTWSKMHALWWVIVADERPVGTVWVERDTNGARRGELGIFIGLSGSRGIGIGSKAVLLAEQFAADIWNVETVNLRVRATNERARRCYAKIGYHDTRTFQKVLQSGERIDVIEMEHRLKMPNQSTDPTLASVTPDAGHQARHP